MKRVGVFICHCGVNIAGTVDVKKVAEELSNYKGVVLATDYVYMCSDPGQNLIREKIKEHRLESVVVACCSPTLHENTFRKTVSKEGLNPYQCEIANIREQCSWVHRDKEKATKKAIKIVKSMVEKVLLDESLEPISVPITKRVLVIGGGISGIQAALDVANSGYEVVLVEKSPSIGGHMIQLSETFPTLDCSQCIFPATYTLDIDSCAGLLPIACGKCLDVCEPGAIDYDMKPEIVEEKVGAIIIATGYELYPKEKMAEYGYGRYPDVLDGLQFERLLSASGPTGGEVRRPSDHKIPKEVVFIQCAGSRDPELHMPYCSKICCMYTAKHAMLYKHRVPDGQAYIFYIDIRSGGKGYEEFVQRAVEEDGVLYLRGKVSKIFEENGKLVVWGVDTLSGKDIQIKADLVVLAMAMRPSNDIDELLKVLKIPSDEHGFLSEAHPKLRPVESVSAGIFLAGCAQAPKDIPETVAQASGAASKAVALFSEDRLYHDPLVVEVEEELCSGCKLCIPVCPYNAREYDEAAGIVRVNEVLCEGCGACASACPSGVTQQRNFTDQQIYSMVKAILKEDEQNQVSP